MTAARRVRASAPGKTILMGEHAAVYGRPALVAAIGKRLEATVEVAAGRSAAPGVSLHLPALGVEEKVAWPELARYAAERRQIWQEAQGAGPASFAKIRGEDPAHLVKTALGELLLFAGQLPEGAASLEIASELPLGSGFGSSAACATAVLLAAATALGIPLGEEELLRLALEAERRQHGAPSGVDNATVLHGGLLWVERDQQGKLAIEKLTVKERLLPGLRFFQSGEPAEPTGAVVAAVKARRQEDPEAFDARLDDMEAATRELRQAIAEPGQRSRPIALFRRFEAHLEAFGVVPPAVRAVIRDVERQGGAAKISGAGSLAGPGAGSLLVLEGREGLEVEWPETFRELSLELGAPGARLES